MPNPTTHRFGIKLSGNELPREPVAKKANGHGPELRRLGGPHGARHRNAIGAQRHGDVAQHVEVGDVGIDDVVHAAGDVRCGQTAVREESRELIAVNSGRGVGRGGTWGGVSHRNRLY
jgi:hypothetical protein